MREAAARDSGRLHSALEAFFQGALTRSAADAEKRKNLRLGISEETQRAIMVVPRTWLAVGGLVSNSGGCHSDLRACCQALGPLLLDFQAGLRNYRYNSDFDTRNPLSNSIICPVLSDTNN
jgi:hypothetical protein